AKRFLPSKNRSYRRKIVPTTRQTIPTIEKSFRPSAERFLPSKNYSYHLPNGSYHRKIVPTIRRTIPTAR
ncbi:MAG TPA: hypothetical protein P5526_28300, partial [Anaerolineae bacterium]|nr:hypothetical protein [Anaerolineae bacterium]